MGFVCKDCIQLNSPDSLPNILNQFPRLKQLELDCMSRHCSESCIWNKVIESRAARGCVVLVGSDYKTSKLNQFIVDSYNSRLEL